ncbi:type II CRISPR RNA-guided endonuclease Cas9 [Companilactobacillus jidongensis]|uniref:type II CRISPR RNA-guided endonuclease Cas9 n=1 Tax=Companilactobacillus jidongensis TaxID=2486006 RepID=UPI000F79F589|nr:type II CRISPR RNA-guided endonuclease Cas9 [Companilactobacillus jidongensis]
MKKNISLGLDIGISSVGFSVVDVDTGKIVELGARIFNGADASRNKDRRTMRGIRRLIRRKRQRRIDTVKLFEKYGLIDNRGFSYFEKFNNNINPYVLRVKGLTERLTILELSKALYHLVKRRGISYDLSDYDEEENGSDYSQSLKLNSKELINKTPGEIQLERLRKYGTVRGNTVIDPNVNNSDILLNVFPTKNFVEEAKKIIEKQREFYPEILSNDFENDYITILSRKRNYFVGPGSKKSRTNYGIFKEDGRTLKNLFEELIGHDKIYPEELRASAASYTAQKFNVLNDLNNLRILNHEDQKLTTNEKKEILDELCTETKRIQMVKLIKKIAKCSDDDIQGFRTDNNDKPEISSMSIYRKIHVDYLKDGVDISNWPVKFIDDLSFILTLNTENGEIRKRIEEDLVPIYGFLNDDLIQFIIDHKSSFNISTNNKWHRLSVKSMNLLIPEMVERPVEQMTLFNEMGLNRNNSKKFINNKFIPYKQISSDIFNPVVSKSVTEALKVVNKIIKNYGSINYIVIEMPRDDNEKDAKKEIEDFQKENKKQKNAALTAVVEEIGNKSIVDDALRMYGSKLFFKIRLWYQQDGIDLYSGKTISVSDLLSNPDMFEIDHIIPQSVSLDDGINNKTLCYSDMNKVKDKMTPLGFMNKGYGQGFEVMKAMVMSNNKLAEKRKNYLFMEDINDIETRKRFIARNLVDTRYASKVVLNNLQEFFSEKNIDTKISVIRGKFTSNMRKHWHIYKSRETYYHHAIDASIIAATPFLKIWEKGATMFPDKIVGNSIDIETGEILDDKTFDKVTYVEPYVGFVEELNNSDKRVKFSHQVDKKMNRKVSDATLYSTRIAKLSKDKQESEYVVSKIKNIYDAGQYSKFKKIYDKDMSKFLLYKYDIRSFSKLENIMNNYPDHIEKVQDNGSVKSIKISPFELYRRDHGMVRKYSKKNNGPEIKQLKYLDKKVGSNIDITPCNAKNKHVVLQSLSPWRTDVYFNRNTGEYEIMGLKYSDLKFNKSGIYGINKEKYLEIKARENVSNDSEFVFTLYRKDRIKVENLETKENVEVLFWSRTMEKKKGYAELKPIDKSESVNTLPIYGKGSNGRLIKRLIPKKCKIWKVNTDILGNPFYIEKEGEEPKDILD